MTDPDIKNGQVIASVERTNDIVLKHAEEVALGNLYQSVSQAISLSALNATFAQQQNYTTAQAVVNMGVSTLYSLNTAADSFLI